MNSFYVYFNKNLFNNWDYRLSNIIDAHNNTTIKNEKKIHSIKLTSEHWIVNERRKIMVKVKDATHAPERQVMQQPSNEKPGTSVDWFPICPCIVLADVATLNSYWLNQKY